MCQEDQVALLKGGCTEMMILRSLMQYDVDHSTWKIPHSQEMVSSIKSDLLKLAKNNLYEEYENFIRSFDHRLRKDENIILIMSAIVLFTPNRPKTIHTEVLIMEQVTHTWNLLNFQTMIVNDWVFSFPEFLLLFIKTLFGEHIPGLWSKINIFEFNTQNQRARASQRRNHCSLFRC